MLRRVLRDLTLSDFVVGGGPLVLAVWFFVRASLVDGSFARWAWIACAVAMLVICGAYLTWVWRRRHELRDRGEAQLDSDGPVHGGSPAHGGSRGQLSGE